MSLATGLQISEVMAFVVRHSYLVLFSWILAEQAGVPIPSIPLLLVSGALVRTGELKLTTVFLSALPACFIADNVWFQLGKRYSTKALRLACRISLEPDSCVRRTENTFAKYGFGSLAVAKFVPGLNAVAVPLAGGSGVNRSRFLLLDTMGTLLWITAYVLGGYLFSDQLEVALRYAMRMGSDLVAIVVVGVAAWLKWKYVQRDRFMREIRTARISPEELRQILDSGGEVTIVDVRSEIASGADSIPEALKIPIEALRERHREIPRDREIVLVCT